LTRARAARPAYVDGLLLLAVALVGFTVSLLWGEGHRERVVDGTDAPQYQAIATNLALGNGFSMSGSAPYVPTLYREPGYPLLVGAVYRAFGRDNDWVARVQAALVAAIAGLTYALARHFAGPAFAFVGGLLAALSPDLADLARQVLSEVLFTALLTGSVLAAVLAHRRSQLHWFALCGGLFGLSALVRAQTVALFGMLLVIWLLVSRRTWRQTLPRLALAACCALLVAGPWLARNVIVLDTPALTSRSGVTLLRRAPKVDATPGEMLAWAKAAAWMAGYPVSALLVPFESFQYGRLYYENRIWDFHVNESVRVSGRYDHVCSMTDWEACATEISLGFVRERPIVYLAQFPLEWVKLNFKPLPAASSLVRSGIVWLFLVSTIALWRARRLGGGLGWVLGVIGIHWAMLAGFDAQERYAVPVLPLYAVVIGCGSAVLAQRVTRAVVRPGLAWLRAPNAGA
jgi:4-amino-4-deoxy-L-arabinose transferase-like glycosyltransferase